VEHTERQYFELLKEEIVRVMRQTNPGITIRPGNWKGKEISAFQEDLLNKAKAHISEKWFYTHFKSVNEKLPRIDSLNILCKYVGYADWTEFKNKNRDKVAFFTAQKGSNKVFYFLPVMAILGFVLFWVVIKLGSMATYSFCFVDSYSKEPIEQAGIEVTLMLENESPLSFMCDSSGCFAYRTGATRLRFIVRSPYYFTDTITRVLNKREKSEEVQLKINDYALMIDYFAHSKVEDWLKRKEQLNEMIADSAYICQVIYGSMMGMELFNKDEFIEMLTVPSTSLQNIRIIDMLYRDNKIISVRFTK